VVGDVISDPIVSYKSVRLSILGGREKGGMRREERKGNELVILIHLKTETGSIFAQVQG
jgi:hypothetical protein